jgi:hypothetical protein
MVTEEDGVVAPATPGLKADEPLFKRTLKRNNRQLKDDRADLIYAAAEKFYRRKVEDLRDELDQIEVDRLNMLDVSPSNTQLIINPSDFNTAGFVDGDIEKGLQARETRIKLETAMDGYTKYFGTYKAPN